MNKKYKGFDSKLEEARYNELKALEKHGIIKNLIKQPTFILTESKKILKNNEVKTIRGIKYTADFVYERDRDTIVEDVKGFKTDAYKIKSKIFIANMDKFKIDEFREVYKNDTIIYRQLREDEKIRQLGRMIWGAKYNFIRDNEVEISKDGKKIKIVYKDGYYYTYSDKNTFLAKTKKITDKKILLYLNK